MSKAINNLRKIEKRSYAEWSRAVRYAAECRNAVLTADQRDRREKKAALTLALANADRTFTTWCNVCDTLDEIEQAGLNGHTQ
jgi:hypothetical protein